MQREGEEGAEIDAALEERLEERREGRRQAAVRAEPHLPVPRDLQADLHANIQQRRGADEGRELGERDRAADRTHRRARSYEAQEVVGLLAPVVQVIDATHHVVPRAVHVGEEALRWRIEEGCCY